MVLSRIIYKEVKLELNSVLKSIISYKTIESKKIKIS